jgi:hypothetical protein
MEGQTVETIYHLTLLRVDEQACPSSLLVQTVIHVGFGRTTDP